MAFSGTGGAYYRSNAAMSNAEGFHNAYTVHIFAKGPVPSGAGNWAVLWGCIGNGAAGAQRPQSSFFWDRPSAERVLGHRRNNDVYTFIQLPSAPAANTWCSIACTFDGTFLRTYLNGGAAGVSTATGPSHNAPVWLDLMAQLTTAGALEVTSNFDIGETAEYAIWNAALTAAEIESLAKGFRASRVRPQSLKEYYPLIRGLQGVRGGRTLNKVAGTEIISDHPRVFG